MALIPLVSASVNSVRLPVPIMIFNVGIFFPQGVIADNGSGKSEVDRVQDTIGNKRLILRLEAVYQPVQRSHVSVLLRDQDGDGGRFLRYPGTAFMQTQQVIGARFCAAQQLILFQGIDTDRITGVM